METWFEVFKNEFKIYEEENDLDFQFWKISGVNFTV